MVPDIFVTIRAIIVSMQKFEGNAKEIEVLNRELVHYLTGIEYALTDGFGVPDTYLVEHVERIKGLHTYIADQVVANDISDMEFLVSTGMRSFWSHQMPNPQRRRIQIYWALDTLISQIVLKIVMPE